MFTLSDKFSKDEYIANAGKDVLLGNAKVTIVLDYVYTKSGSYERGFKFGSITYGLLKRRVTKSYSWDKKKTYEVSEFSADHGKTWHSDPKAAKKVKGKSIVKRSTPLGEFAFDAIQQMNREYYGAGYKWHP